MKRGVVAKLAFIFLSVVIAGTFLAIWQFKKGAAVYVHNLSSETMTAYLDEREVLKVPPGKCRPFACSRGSWHIVVKRGDQVVFDRQVDLECDVFKETERNYLINPGSTARYFVYTARYLRSFFSGGDDGEEDASKALKELVDRSIPLDKSDWIDANPDFVLDVPPSIQLKKKAPNSRTILLQGSDEILALIAEYKNTPSITDREVQRWKHAVRSLDEAAE